MFCGGCGSADGGGIGGGEPFSQQPCPLCSCCVVAWGQVPFILRAAWNHRCAVDASAECGRRGAQGRLLEVRSKVHSRELAVLLEDAPHVRLGNLPRLHIQTHPGARARACGIDKCARGPYRMTGRAHRFGTGSILTRT